MTLIDHPSLFLALQDGMNSVQLAVVGGHIKLVRDLVDTFKATIDFSTDVRMHAYILHTWCAFQPYSIQHSDL